MSPTETSSPVLAPISASERISAVDVARGFALLGILLMNIVGWGLPAAAYFNPLVAGGTTGWNLAAWAIQMTFFDGKMRALFSMLFGAGVIVLTRRAEERGAGVHTADIYYRRMMWMILFGIAHAFLLWWGDILYPYALYGLILFPLRNVRPKNLLIVVGVMLGLLTAMSVGQGFYLKHQRAQAAEAAVAEKAGKKLTSEQKEAKEEWEKTLKHMQPSPEEIKKETDAFRGNYIANVKQRAALVAPWHGMPYYAPMAMDLVAMMLAGMALLKLEVLTGKRPRSFYMRMAALGFLIGLPINALSSWQGYAHQFDITTMPIAFAPYHVGRLAVALAYLAILMIVVQSGVLRQLISSLAAVGQMAFSNYVAQSVMCNFVFYGFGLGLFGKLERYQLYSVVLAVWVVHLVWSSLWLRHYRFGPLEWCWRSLTYWKKQPMRLLKADVMRAEEPGQPATA